MIQYSTNWMGPINVDWYIERGLDPMVDRWSAGRIDIYGLDEENYYNGMLEYSLPPMHDDSWGELSEWMDDLETEELLTFEEIIDKFQDETGHKIIWASDTFDDY